MTRHVSAENLARFRDGDLRPAAARRVAAHLEGCARCQEASAVLAAIPELLAAADVPPIPAHLAARIELAMATETAHRAAGSPSMRVAGRTESGAPERSRRRAALPFPARRVLAAAAVIAVIGGGYELFSHLAGGPAGTAATSSGRAAASSAAGGASRPGHSAGRRPQAAVPEVPGVTGAPVFGPALPYRNADRAGIIRPVRTTTNYQADYLGRQASAVLAQAGAAATASPGVRAGAGPQNSSVFAAGQLTRLAGCVSRVADGRLVLLVDMSRFAGAPATIIVTAAPGSAPAGRAVAGQVWAVGPGCSPSASDILARQPLPRAEVAAPGISQP